MTEYNPSIVETPDASPIVGLSSAEVTQRIQEGKVNGDTTIKTKSVVQILRENIFTFFNFLLVVLAIIVTFFVNFDVDGVANFGFLLLVVFNALVGIVQELRAKRTIDKLSLISAPKVIVLRDGEEKEIAVKDIVLDDVTILSAGSQICADADIIDGSIEVNESLITGEPDAILKNPGDHIMSGSFVVSGKASAKVVHIGMDNFATKISAGAKYFKKPNSEIWRSLMFVVKVMAAIILPLGIALFCVKYFVQDINAPIDDTVLTTIGTLVGMIPSGLVALSSTVFCVSIIRLSKYKTLAQDLYCVETLARVDVLCLDKTGTITEGSMEVNQILPANGANDDDIKQIIKNITGALDDDNATINALRDYVGSLECSANADSIVPFSSARKWSGAHIDGVSYVIGAPEFVFGKLTGDMQSTVGEMADKGYRVMVLATSDNPFEQSSLPENLKLQSYIFITDKIRPEAPDTLRFFREEGVTVKIISGDNPSTVRAVAMRAGLEDCDNIIDMSTLTTEEEVYAAAEKYTIFGRVMPDQKLMLVKALKAAGHTVAMTGDGVNDVLALKEADCSIAMASGSDAAKNVSSLVLMDSNFASMPRVVAEGRRSINNLERSAALYLMKTVYNTLIAILFMCVSAELPFEPKHLTLIGMVTIGIPSVVLALEPNKERVTGRFLPKVLANAIPGGIAVILGISGILICSKFFLPGLQREQVQTMAIIVVTIIGLVFLTKVSLPLNWIHCVLLIAMVGLFIASYLLPFPLLQEYFGLEKSVTREMAEAMACIALVVVPLYILLCLLMRSIKKRHGDWWENQFDLLDGKMRANLAEPNVFLRIGRLLRPSRLDAKQKAIQTVGAEDNAFEPIDVATLDTIETSTEVQANNEESPDTNSANSDVSNKSYE